MVRNSEVASFPERRAIEPYVSLFCNICLYLTSNIFSCLAQKVLAEGNEYYAQNIYIQRITINQSVVQDRLDRSALLISHPSSEKSSTQREPLSNDSLAIKHHQKVTLIQLHQSRPHSKSPHQS